MTIKLAPSVVILVASHGRVIFLRGYGVLDVKSRRPVSPNTHFEIGYVTKQFTAAAIMQLLDAGKLSLEDTLSKYVPTYTVGASVTMQQPLWQTSGILA